MTGETMYRNLGLSLAMMKKYTTIAYLSLLETKRYVDSTINVTDE